MQYRSRSAGVPPEDPAEVCVEQAVERAVRIAHPIGMGVMLQVIGRPVDAPSLARHRSKGEEDRPHRGMAPKALVGQQPVKSQGHAKACHEK